MKTKKFLIVAVLMIIIMGSGISVAASPNVSGLLTEWFQSENDDAIEEIDKSVDDELKEQTERLQEELKPVIDSVRDDIDTYKDEKKQEAVNELEKYSDQLIENATTNDAINKKRYEKDLENIVDQAIKLLEEVEPESTSEREGNGADPEANTAGG